VVERRTMVAREEPEHRLRHHEVPFLREGCQSIPETWVTQCAFCKERKMPWKECRPMDERLKFIARPPDGKQMLPGVRYLPQVRLQNPYPLQ
jgi:hypothetical protein